MKRWLLSLSVALLIVTLGCDGKDEPEATPTSDPSSTATATATLPPSVGPSPTAPPGGGTLIPSRVQLIDIRSGKVTTLYESADKAAFGARFDGDVVEIAFDGGARRFNLDGTPSNTPLAPPACRTTPAGAEIAGRTFAGINCGVVSPNGRWMTYHVEVGNTMTTTGFQVPLWDQWMLEVATGATRELQKGLVHCGGCDARYGPRWSPTSEYVAYAELGGEKRRFLSNVETGATRIIGAGNEVTDAPVWAAQGNRIIYSTTAHGAVARIEDLDAGTVRDLPIAWPVRFDPSGTYLYSPPWDDDPKATGKVTTVIDAQTFASVASIPGVPARWLSWVGGVPLGEGTAGYVAAFQSSPDCAGTSIAVEGTTPVCIPAGIEGTVSPNGSLVAVAAAEGLIGPAYGPGFQTIQLLRCGIIVFGTETKTQSRLLGDIPSWDYGSPLVAWNGAGTHLLVLSPHAVGL